MAADVTQGDALAAVAEEGGSSSVKLLGDIFAAQAREQEWLADTIQGGLERERDEWRERALYAEDRLHRIEERILGLLS
jgi:hypothetical protein